MGIVVLLSGFTVTEVEFNSADVPPSKFKIRLAVILEQCSLAT